MMVVDQAKTQVSVLFLQNKGNQAHEKTLRTEANKMTDNKTDQQKKKKKIRNWFIRV